MERELPYREHVRDRIRYLHKVVSELIGLPEEEISKDLYNLETVIINFPRYIPERVFAHLYTKIKDSDKEIDFCVNKDEMDIEKIVMNNYIFGDLKSLKEVTLNSGKIYKKEKSLFNSLLEGETYMRVNVLHPMFLSDQWLVAEYREVKMGPKALSKSLFSKGGVNKNRISPVYTLNTGHTYFFYDKNKFLEKRLAQLVHEMTLRGIEHNFVELIDDKYDYHPNTFNDEWWNDWQPDEAALNINMERLHERIAIKEDGWYRFWKRPVLDVHDIISTRAQNSFYECPNCKAIHIAPEGDNWKCWKCCSKIPSNLEPKSYY